MPTTVEAPGGPKHEENVFYAGDLLRFEEDEGQYGPQWKLCIVLDDDEPFVEDDGTERDRETWTWCSKKLTTHERNSFRKVVKGLTGAEPVIGQLFDERHYTREWYEQNPNEDPVANTGREKPWRVRVMFEHKPQPDQSVKETVAHLVKE